MNQMPICQKIHEPYNTSHKKANKKHDIETLNTFA